MLKLKWILFSTFSVTVLLMTSVLFWGCNQCDDMGCTSIHVQLDSSIVPEGGSFFFEATGMDDLTCATEWVTCDQKAHDITIFDSSYRPETITVIVLDAEEKEVGRYDAKPKYGVIEQSLCDCPGAETVFVP